MGSKHTTKTKQQYRQQPGKVNTPLSKKLEKVEWGEFKLEDLFEIKHYGKQRSKEDLQKNGVFL